MHIDMFRRAGFASVAGLLLSLSACRTSPCSPPSCASEPSPCAPPMAVASRPCAPPPVAAAPLPSVCVPRPSPVETERLKIQEDTIARQQEAIVAERQAREAAEADARKNQALVDSMKAAPQGEDAAEKFEAELHGMTGARILRESNRVIVVITDTFEPGSDVLKPSSDVRTAILSTAAAILRHPEAKVQVVGHSDGTPLKKTADKWTDNVQLSKARAATVAKAMQSNGVASERLAVDGRGSAEPLVSPEKTKSDRAKNRRVEIQLSF